MLTTTAKILVLTGNMALVSVLAQVIESPPDEPRHGSSRAGHVLDTDCQACHREIYDTYQSTGMARSFVRAGAGTAIEDFSRARGEHKPSQRHYSFSLEGDDYVFRRHQTDQSGNEINVFEQKVDWILGSGSKSRSYLYQTPSGELFQLPIA